MEHAAEGLFDNAIETTWTRGENTEVFWASGGRHRGGYAYRLCKVPGGDITKVNFSCMSPKLVQTYPCIVENWGITIAPFF